MLELQNPGSTRGSKQSQSDLSKEETLDLHKVSPINTIGSNPVSPVESEMA